MTQAVSKQFLTNVADEVKEETKQDSREDAERKPSRMVSADQYIGDLITLDYGHADILRAFHFAEIRDPHPRNR